MQLLNWIDFEGTSGHKFLLPKEHFLHHNQNFKSDGEIVLLGATTFGIMTSSITRTRITVAVTSTGTRVKMVFNITIFVRTTQSIIRSV